jgi:hypothetical protein
MGAIHANAHRASVRLLQAIAVLVALTGPAIAQNPDVNRQNEPFRQIVEQQLAQARAQAEQQARAQAQQAALNAQLRAVQQAAAQLPPAELARVQVELLLQMDRARALGGAGVQQISADQMFESLAFSQYGGSAAEARRRLESQLTSLVLDIDRTCKLTTVQKDRIRLMGRGDIKRAFDGFDTAKAQLRSASANDPGRLELAFQDVGSLRTALQTSLFQDDSLAVKSLRHTLTEEQFARYDTARQEQQTGKLRGLVQQVMVNIERNAPMSFDRRREVIDLLMRETKPPRSGGQYDFYAIIYQISRLPDEKLRPLLNDIQWGNLQQYTDRAQMLRQQGLIPDELHVGSK